MRTKKMIQRLIFLFVLVLFSLTLVNCQRSEQPVPKTAPNERISPEGDVGKATPKPN